MFTKSISNNKCLQNLLLMKPLTMLLESESYFHKFQFSYCFQSFHVKCRATVTLQSIGGFGLNFLNLTPPDQKSWIRLWRCMFISRFRIYFSALNIRAVGKRTNHTTTLKWTPADNSSVHLQIRHSLTRQSYRPYIKASGTHRPQSQLPLN